MADASKTYTNMASESEQSSGSISTDDGAGEKTSASSSYSSKSSASSTGLGSAAIIDDLMTIGSMASVHNTMGGSRRLV